MIKETLINSSFTIFFFNVKGSFKLKLLSFEMTFSGTAKDVVYTTFVYSIYLFYNLLKFLYFILRKLKEMFFFNFKKHDIENVEKLINFKNSFHRNGFSIFYSICDEGVC